MASRFVVADNNVIEELKTSSENSNTRKSRILWLGVLAALRNIEDMDTYEVQELGKFTIDLSYNYGVSVHKLFCDVKRG